MPCRNLFLGCALCLSVTFRGPIAVGEAFPSVEDSAPGPFADIPLYDITKSGKTDDESEKSTERSPSRSPEAAKAFNEVFYVNDLGDPKRLVFEGVSLFPEEQLRNALALDLKYQAAARPSNETGDFLDAIEKRLRDGYLQSGCPDAQVSAQRDGNRRAIVVRVDEGSRYRMGDIHVHGDQRLDDEAIATWLTTVQTARPWSCMCGDKSVCELPNEEDTDAVAFWSPGSPVDFRETTNAKLHAAIHLAFIELGFANADFHTELRRAESNELVHLEIIVHDDPPPYIIGRIDVTGLKRDSREALLRYLEIGEGASLDAELLTRFSDRLSDSCRFWKYDIRVILPPAGWEASENQVVLRLSAEEFAAAPPLGEPLSAIDEAMRKSAAWIKSLSTIPNVKDVVCTVASADLGGTAQAMKVVLAAEGTIAVETRLRAAGVLDLNHTLVLNSSSWEIYDWRSGDKFCMSNLLQPRITLSIGPAETETGEQKAHLSFGYSDKSTTAKQKLTNALCSIRAEPAAMLRLVHLPSSKTKLRDGILSVTHDEFEFEIDQETGAIRSIKAADFLPFGISVIYLENREGAVEDVLADTRHRAADFPNRYDESNPVVSMFSFALEQIERQPAVQKSDSSTSVCRCVRRLVESAEFQHLLASWKQQRKASHEEDNDLKFRIADMPVGELDKFGKFVYYAPAIADAMFPRGSWPWTLLRETCFWCFSNGAADESSDKFREMAGRELHRLHESDQGGPVGNLLLAKALSKVYGTLPQCGALLAAQGLAKLSDDAFLQDVKLLTHGDHGMAVACRAIVGQLGKLSEDDQQQVREFLPENWREPVERLMERRKEKPDELAEAAITQILMDAWHDELRETVATELRSMSIEVAQAAIPDEAEAATTK